MSPQAAGPAVDGVEVGVLLFFFLLVTVGAMFATGAVAGWFAVPYTILVYPLIFVFMPRMWSVAHRRGYITPADFVRGRYDSRSLSLAVALTGILATMPYIARSWSASRPSSTRSAWAVRATRSCATCR